MGDRPTAPSPWYDADYWPSLDTYAAGCPEPEPPHTVEYQGSAWRISAVYDTEAECREECEGA